MPRVTWYGLILVGTVTAHGCVAEPEPGGFSLSLAPNAAVVGQGGAQSVTAQVTRTGSFTGSVDLFVTGQPAGIIVTVSDIRTASPITTATVTFTVNPAVPPAKYQLVLHGTGRDVDEVTHPFELTITPDLGFSIALSVPVLSISQGTSTPGAMVRIFRSYHHGAVDLEVTGAPAGVAVSLTPATGLTGDQAALSLTVGTDAPMGNHDLLVTARDPARTGSVTTMLRLIVLAPPSYAFSLSATELSFAQGSSGGDVRVRLLRDRYDGDVALSLENAPPGVWTGFFPNPATGSTADLSVFVGASVVPGTYSNLLLRGVAEGLVDRVVPVTLTVTVAPFTLALSQSELQIEQGAAAATVTVTIVRNSESGPVTLYVDTDLHGSLPPGVTAYFAPNSTSGNSSVLTLTVSNEAVPGIYFLGVHGKASTGWFIDGPWLTLTITAPSGSPPPAP